MGPESRCNFLHSQLIYLFECKPAKWDLSTHPQQTPSANSSLMPCWPSMKAPASALSGGDRGTQTSSTSSLEAGMMTETCCFPVISHKDHLTVKTPPYQPANKRRSSGFFHHVSFQGDSSAVQCLRKVTEGSLLLTTSLLCVRCWSYIGRQTQGQAISLRARGCLYTGTVQHEVLHALGFHHEQARSDRDDYITILTENIIPGQLFSVWPHSPSYCTDDAAGITVL